MRERFRASFSADITQYNFIEANALYQLRIKLHMSKLGSQVILNKSQISSFTFNDNLSTYIKIDQTRK